MKTGLFLLAAIPFCIACSESESDRWQSPAAFVQFALYYLDEPEGDPVETLRDAIPDDVLWQTVKGEADMSRAQIHAELIREVQRDHTPPDREYLEYYGYGLDSEQVDALQQSPAALVVTYIHPADEAAERLRAAESLIHKMAMDAGAVIWDEATRATYTPTAWQTHRMATWDNGIPSVVDQIVIHAYQDGDGIRAVTLGMEKFALPDLVMEDMSWSDARSAGNLMNALAQLMVEGTSPDTEVDLRLSDIRHPSVSEFQQTGLKANATGTATVSLVSGTHQEGDSDNTLLELRFETYDGPDDHARRTAALDRLYGYEDEVVPVRPDERLAAASELARAQLPALREHFLAGMEPGEYVSVKSPFTTDSGGVEYMWVGVRAWEGEKIEGILNNEPYEVSDLQAGQMVTVQQSEVFDYIHTHADGSSTGNTTAEIIMEMQSQ